jgi:hypothetical protein
MSQHGPNEAPILPIGRCRNTAPTEFFILLADAATRLQQSSTSRWPMPQHGSNGVLRPVGRCRNAAPTEFFILLANAATRLQQSSTSRWPMPQHGSNRVLRPVGRCRNAAPTELFILFGRHCNAAPTEFYVPLADAATRLQRSSSSRWPTPQRGSNRVLCPVGRCRNAAPTEFDIFCWPTP